MTTQRLVAKERFYYGGRNVEMGEEFDAEEMDVALLIHAHTPKATILQAEPKRAEADKPDELGRTEKPESETQGDRKKATYKRKDMKAEE